MEETTLVGSLLCLTIPGNRNHSVPYFHLEKKEAPELKTVAMCKMLGNG